MRSTARGGKNSRRPLLEPNHVVHRRSHRSHRRRTVRRRRKERMNSPTHSPSQHTSSSSFICHSFISTLFRLHSTLHTTRPGHRTGTPHPHDSQYRPRRTGTPPISRSHHTHKLRPAPSTTPPPRPSMILEVAAAMTLFSFGPTLLGVHFARGLHIGKLTKAAMLASPPSAQDVRDVCDSR